MITSRNITNALFVFDFATVKDNFHRRRAAWSQLFEDIIKMNNRIAIIHLREQNGQRENIFTYLDSEIALSNDTLGKLYLQSNFPIGVGINQEIYEAVKHFNKVIDAKNIFLISNQLVNLQKAQANSLLTHDGAIFVTSDVDSIIHAGIVNVSEDNLVDYLQVLVPPEEKTMLKPPPRRNLSGWRALIPLTGSADSGNDSEKTVTRCSGLGCTVS